MNQALLKKQIEKEFGIPYEIFCELDPEVIEKLIETKIGKKLKPDYRVIIDGIPIDKDHVIERREIDGMLSNKFEKFIKVFKRKWVFAIKLNLW